MNKDGIYIHRDGYRMIYVGNGKYRPEHVLVMEKHLGRKLARNEIPHHIDESFEGRSNNDINNLQLMTRSEHTKHHCKNKGYYVSFYKLNSKWRLFIYNELYNEYRSAGMYKTKEEALKIVEQRYKLKVDERDRIKE